MILTSEQNARHPFADGIKQHTHGTHSKTLILNYFSQNSESMVTYWSVRSLGKAMTDRVQNPPLQSSKKSRRRPNLTVINIHGSVGVIIQEINCHPAPCYFNSDKLLLTLSYRYCNPEWGFEPGSSAFNCV